MMLLKRNNEISKDHYWFYNLKPTKAICFEIENDRSINAVGLTDVTVDNKCEWFNLKTLCYMENITLDDGELLNVDALLALAKREDNA